MSEQIRVFLVDDHAVVRMGIRTIFERAEGFLVCGEAGSLKEGYERAKELDPDVIIPDWKLPDGNGINGCINFKKYCPT